MTNEIEYELQVLPAALMMQHFLDDDTVLRLNNYLDVLKNDTAKTSAGPDLVGQIHQGEQIMMDYNAAILKPFVSIVESLGLAYLLYLSLIHI